MVLNFENTGLELLGLEPHCSISEVSNYPSFRAVQVKGQSGPLDPIQPFAVDVIPIKITPVLLLCICVAGMGMWIISRNTFHCIVSLQTSRLCTHACTHCTLLTGVVPLTTGTAPGCEVELRTCSTWLKPKNRIKPIFNDSIRKLPLWGNWFTKIRRNQQCKVLPESVCLWPWYEAILTWLVNARISWWPERKKHWSNVLKLPYGQPHKGGKEAAIKWSAYSYHKSQFKIQDYLSHHQN